MENKEFDRVIGSSDAPYLNELARTSTLLTDDHAVTHPSLPNYLALLGGSNFGISSNCTTCTVHAPNLADQLDAAGVSWKAYMEDLPSPCFTGAAAGRYARKHDPFVYFDDIRDDPGRCRKVVPFSELASDLAANRLSAFSWITPNLCDDTHDCPVSDGDGWLREWVPRLLVAVGPNGIVVVTYDEGSTNEGCCGHAAGGRVATVIAGPGARRRLTLRSAYDHYSLLRLIEDNWGLGHLGGAACRCTPSITGWRP